jgi:hypothetical protein
MGRNYTNKLIASSQVVKNLGTNVPVCPKNEAQARPLTKLSPDLQRQAWQSKNITQDDTLDIFPHRGICFPVFIFFNPLPPTNHR